MPYFCANKEGNHRHHSCFSHFHPMPQSKACNKFKPCLTFLLTQRLAMPYYSTHRRKTHAAPIFNKQSATKTPADHLLRFVRGSRGVQANMAKRLNAEIRLIAGDEIQATASHSQTNGGNRRSWRGEYRARGSATHRGHVDSPPT